MARALAMAYVVGWLLPSSTHMPVVDATRSDWNQDSFWYQPWGASGVHRGIDIFAENGTDVVSANHGWVLLAGDMGRGGNAALVLGPRWRLYYYAHLAELHVASLRLVTAGTKLGSVGTSGNARGKQPHLHFSIRTLAPFWWQLRLDPYGFLRCFYVDPGAWLS